MRRLPLPVPALVALAMVVLTACAGSPSKASFVTKADAVCAPGNGSLAGVAKPTNQPELATAAGTVASTVEAQAAGLRKLAPPKSDKAQVAGVVGALAEVPARALQDAVAKTDDRATASAVLALKAIDPTSRQAHDLELELRLRALPD